MTEGVVAKWYKNDGARVEAGDDVYEMEYDKAAATVRAKTSGVLKQFCGEGSAVPVGQAVGVILEDGETLENVEIAGRYDSADSKVSAQSPAEPQKTEKADADVIVIGGGPGGYVAALKLGLLGASVILIEKDRVGGTCLNRGCIPTKALLQSAETFERTLHGEEIGVEAQNVKINLKQVNAYKQKTVDTLVKGVEGLLRARKVRVVAGEAYFNGGKTISVKLAAGEQKILSAEHIIIASGSKSAAPPIDGINGKNVITSTEALDVENLPGSIAIIGGGVIGMEIGAAYADFGVKVTVIEAMDRILPGMDGEISKEYLKCIKDKIKVHTSARVESISDARKKKLVKFSENGTSCAVEAEKVLVAVGRTPDTEALHLEKSGILTEHSKVLVDDNFETNISGIYCIGDANAKIMLAHAASAQGIHVAQRIMGKGCGIAQQIVPSCVYTDPEIASVGLTEEQVKEKGIPYKTGKFSFRANGRSLVLGKASGFVKIIGSAKHNEVLGVHIIGPYATEMIAECAVAMRLEACVEDIANTIHAHPTVSESIMEAAESFLGGAIHSL